MGQQHYRFAYGGLKQFAFNRSAEMKDALWSEPQPFLEWLWGVCAEDEGENEPSTGLSARTFEHDGHPAALITLPEPQEPPQAYYVLIVWGTDTHPDFYSLEKGSADYEGTGTFICRWYPTLRSNLGPGPAPPCDPETFINCVLAPKTGT